MRIQTRIVAPLALIASLIAYFGPSVGVVLEVLSESVHAADFAASEQDGPTTHNFGALLASSEAEPTEGESDTSSGVRRAAGAAAVDASDVASARYPFFSGAESTVPLYCLHRAYLI